MPETRIRIQSDIEKSLTAGSLVVTDAQNEQRYLPPTTNTHILTLVGGVPVWQAPATAGSFIISDGTTTQVIDNGNTLLITQGNGISRTVSATDTLNIALRLSADAGNDLTFGGDGGLYASLNNLITGASWNDATNTLVFTLDGGGTINVPLLDSISNFLLSFTVIGDSGGALTINNGSTISFVGSGGINVVRSGNIFTINGSAGTLFEASGLTTGSTVTIPANKTIIEVSRNGIERFVGAGHDYTFVSATGVLTFARAFGSSSGAAITGERVLVRYI